MTPERRAELKRLLTDATFGTEGVLRTVVLELLDDEPQTLRMAGGQVIAELPGAKFHQVSHDELGFDQKEGHTDTIKMRFGSWLPLETQYFAALAFDWLKRDGGDVRRYEKILLKFAYDEVPGHEGWGRMPVFQVYCQESLNTTEDETMRLVCTICSRGVFDHVRGNVGGSELGSVSKELVSPSGNKVLSLLDDGKVVVYDMERPAGQREVAELQVKQYFIPRGE
jgi:hypothetical protein